jgi:Domain of unknown function (DUF1788)
MPSRAEENISQTFAKLYEVIRSEPFLERRGLGNELPFFISAYHPSLEGEVDTSVSALATRLSIHGVSVLSLNLYDLVVELLQARGVWPRLLEREPTIPKDQFLQTLLNVTAPKDQLVPLIASKLAASPCRVLLLTGVGLVFPYLRSHSILENLQSVTKQIPTVLFFPGDYSFVDGKGSYLKLFGTLPDDRYYRAFNIADFRP